jgi:hypothetical protein
MKISKNQLKSMIMEELQSVMNEQDQFPFTSDEDFVPGLNPFGAASSPQDSGQDRFPFTSDEDFIPGLNPFGVASAPLDQPAREAFTKRGARRAARDLRADDGLRKNLGRAGRQALRSQFPGPIDVDGVAGTRRSTYRMADIDAIAGRVAQPAMKDPRADLVNALAANAADAQTEAPRPALSSPTLSPEETRAVNFRGAGGYTYAQDPNDPGSFYYSGPGGKTGYAKAGTAAAKSIQAEMETGTSLYRAPAAPSAPPPQSRRAGAPGGAGGTYSSAAYKARQASPFFEHLATPNITEMIYEALLEEFGK